jgi:signal transduction histidine kinase/PAS domain-containing protein
MPGSRSGTIGSRSPVTKHTLVGERRGAATAVVMSHAKPHADRDLLPHLLAGFALAAAAADLLGWSLGVASWTRWVPDLPRMAPTTGLSVALLAAGIAFASQARAGSEWSRRATLAAAAIAGLVAAAVLLAYASRSALGPERLFLYERTEIAHYRGRMSPQTAGALLCIAASLALSVARPPRPRSAQALGTIAAALAIVALGGHVHGVERLFGISSVVGVALPTAFALLALAGGLAALHHDSGLRPVLTRHGPAGRYARRLLFASLVIPFGAAVLLRGGEAMGWYDASFRSGAYVAAMAVLLFGTAWMATRSFLRAEDEREHAAVERSAREAIEGVSRELRDEVEVRKRTEQALRDRDEEARARAAQLAAVLDCIADGVLVYDREGRIVRSTPAADRLLELPPEERRAPVVERVARQYEVLSEDGRRVEPEDMVAVRAAVHGEKVTARIQQVRTGGSAPRWLLISGTPLLVEGQQIGAVVSMTDLTERKRTEQELAIVTRLYAVLSRVNEAIVRVRDEQSLYEAVCRILAEDGAYPLVWVGLVRGRRVAPSAAHGPATAYLRDVRIEVDGELGQGPTGTSVREDHPVINDDFDLNPATRPWREASARHGLRASAAFPLHRGGEVVGALTLYAASPGAFTAKQVSLLGALCADVSYALDAMQHERLRAEAEQALREREQALREADRRKDEFLGMLSHELRNPLAPIRNSVYILRHAAPGGEPAERARAVIERQSEHLTRLVDDLLDVTRIARGKIELRRERLDLRRVVASTAEDFRAFIEGRGVALHASIPEEPLPVDGDATRLAQVVGNLLHNAAKFTGRGDEVTVVARSTEGMAEIRVRDTGAGIEPALLPRVFDTFVQGTQTLARTHGGLGLGLAMVRGLTEMHGGNVRAESAGLGKGADFVVRLPLATMERVQAPPPAAVQPCVKGRRVLVVDDNADGADALAQIVELLGHVAEVAYDGPSAVEKARARRPDVVLCDIGLPGMSGYEVAEALRTAAADGTRLIALTGYAQPEDVRRATAAGFHAHLAKPCDPEAIERLLGS